MATVQEGGVYRGGARVKYKRGAEKECAGASWHRTSAGIRGLIDDRGQLMDGLGSVPQSLQTGTRASASWPVRASHWPHFRRLCVRVSAGPGAGIPHTGHGPSLTSYACMRSHAHERACAFMQKNKAVSSRHLMGQKTAVPAWAESSLASTWLGGRTRSLLARTCLVPDAAASVGGATPEN